MIFNSPDFVIFFAIVFSLYWVLSHRLQNLLLFVAGYIFYGWWDWRFVFLIFGTTLKEYLVGLKISSARHKKEKKAYLILSILMNLALLFIFKYCDFFFSSLQGICDSLHIPLHIPATSILLPIGISFFTFECICYSVDIYRGIIQADRNFFNFAIYINFFPHLVAGPIIRAKNLISQIRVPRSLDVKQVISGFTLATFGFFKKVMIADHLAIAVDPVFANLGITSSLEIICGIFLFSFQIYFDFSGYTDIARGISRSLGFELPINFNIPYLAKNPVDFWERWHISLSTWFRDYLYYPLAITFLRRSQVWPMKYLPHIISMTLIGLWHGASNKFIFFGFYWGLCIVLWEIFSIPITNRIPTVLLIGANYIIVCFGWYLFRITTLGEVSCLWKNTGIQSSLLQGKENLTMSVFFSILVILLEFIFARSSSWKHKIMSHNSEELILQSTNENL